MDDLERFRDEFLTNAVIRMEQDLDMVGQALDRIGEAQVWQRPNGSLNSIGNLILHLCGNITQYGIASLSGIPDTRQRDLEFSVNGGLTKAQLLQRLSETVQRANQTIAAVPDQRLLEHRSVQGFGLSGIGNIIHVVEHFSYHTGQIAFWVKMLIDAPLGFYEGIDLNTKNDL